MSVRDLVILGTSSQQPTRTRNHGAYLLRWNEEGLLFDPGEGTQRQFIFAGIAPPTITRIFVSHFHGDHCLGLGSILMRLNLDKVQHPIHCYYPASGKKFFDRLRYGTIYHENIRVIEHPVTENGQVIDDGKFRIEAYFLDHGVDNIGWRITEPDQRKFYKERLDEYGIEGPSIPKLMREGVLYIDKKKISLDDVSWIRQGDTFAIVVDTKLCAEAIQVAQNAKLFLCEATYGDEHAHLAKQHNHLTASQAASIAKKADVQELVLTHFSARYAILQPLLEEARKIFPKTMLAEDLKKIPFRR